MTPEAQLYQWCKGVSKCPNTRGECCPDFSCCCTSVGWPLEKREAFHKAFAAGDHKTMDAMCIGSLESLISSTNGIYISGKKS